MAQDIVLSVVIPSYKDPLLLKTIDSLLESSVLGDRIEIIPVLDGYWQQIPDNDRVRVVHLGTNGGMRNAINCGVRVARGRYIMRTDEHCMFAPGYDKTLCTQIARNMIVTPRRYFLDPVKWEVMDIPFVDHMKLSIRRCDDTRKFFGVDWQERTQDRLNIPLDETMAMQGSCWIMKHSWWDNVIGELQSEGYGTHYQDSHEMVFKTWKAGGKLMVNKNTWYAHKHRMFPRTHGYGGEEARKGFEYSLNTWEEYYNEIRKAWNI